MYRYVGKYIASFQMKKRKIFKTDCTYTPLSGLVSFLSVLIDAHCQQYSSQDCK